VFVKYICNYTTYSQTKKTALKGPHISAQGNALGHERTGNRALEVSHQFFLRVEESPQGRRRGRLSNLGNTTLSLRGATRRSNLGVGEVSFRVFGTDGKGDDMVFSGLLRLSTLRQAQGSGLAMTE
jgi:hypothetical protein